MCPVSPLAVHNQTRFVKNFIRQHFGPLELTQKYAKPYITRTPEISLPLWKQENQSTDKGSLKDKHTGASSDLMDVAISEMPVCSGQFSDIYTGEWKGCPVYIKVVRLPQPVISKEVDRWRQLSHPNVLPFYGICPIKNQMSLVSPWMKNGNIVDYLKHYQISTDRSHFVDDVAQGLKYLHENGIVHGDLKGKNVLVNEDGRAVLADFGSTSILGPDVLAGVSPPSPVPQEAGARWRAPETFNFEGDEESPDTTASDVYAFGMVTYEILTNQLPFSRLKSDISIMRAVVKGERPPRPPATSDSWNVWGLTNNIWSLIEACWLVQAEDRPTMEDVVGRLALLSPGPLN